MKHRARHCAILIRLVYKKYILPTFVTMPWLLDGSCQLTIHICMLDYDFVKCHFQIAFLLSFASCQLFYIENIFRVVHTQHTLRCRSHSEAGSLDSLWNLHTCTKS
jgi:hypothetical protein